MENNKYSNRFDGIREIGQWTAVTTNFLNFIIKDENRLTGEDIRLLFYLISKLEFNSQNVIEINQNNISIILGRHKTSISKSIKKLKNLNIIAKINKKEYMFNPRYFFINGTRELNTFLINYEKIEDKQFAEKRKLDKKLAEKIKINERIKSIALKQGITNPKEIQELIDMEDSYNAIKFILKNKKNK